MCSRFNSGKNIQHPTSNIQHPVRRTPALDVGCWMLVVGCLATLFLSSNSLAEESSKPARILRVAADPNNLPFSNERREGFENKIAGLIARELNAGIEYTWRAQRRGFFRATLKESQADLVLGVPTDSGRALTTSPYYRSSYVFVFRKDRDVNVRSFDDPALRTLRIGVQLVGDDGVNPPPAQALASRNIITNVVGFMVYGNYSEANPPAKIVEAVASGQVDVAIVWGPLAGYFAKQLAAPLELVPVPADTAAGALPFAFDISLGVSRGNQALRADLDAVLQRKRPEIEKILDEYGIPRVAAIPQNASRGK
jgi:mxaJ protein